MRKNDRTSGMIARALPKRLSTRFALTVVLTNLVAVLLAIAFMLVAIRFITPELEDEAVSTVLGTIDQAVREQAAAADSSAAIFGVSTRLHEAALSGTMPEDLSRTIDAYAQTVGASAIVFMDARDQVIYSSGDVIEVDRLRAALVARGASMWEPGAIDLGGTLNVTASRSITGPDDAAEGAGWFAVAIPLHTEGLFSNARFEIAAPDAPSRDTGESRVVDDPRFDDSSVSSSDGTLHLEAEIPGVDSRTAATAIYEGGLVVDPLVMNLGLWGLAAAIVASVIGLGVGLAVARAIVRPIEDLADHMGRRGGDTIAGRIPAAVDHDEVLPLEIANLIEVFDSTFTDLSEHQAALALAKENALATKATLDIAFVDSLDGKILVTDGVVALMNPSASTHLGLRADEALGVKPEALFVSACLLDENGEPLDTGVLLADSVKRAVVVQLKPAGRGARWIEIHTVIHEHDGDTLLVSTRDVTEERRIDELRNEIVGLVSHDLRAPLTVIAGYLDLMNHDIDAESRVKAISSAQRSAARMQDLLEDLLAATRAEEMFSPTELGRVALREMAEEIVASFQHTSSHQLRLAATCTGEVLGEEKRLRQVLVNLVTNSMKYAPETSRIDVGLTCENGTVVLAVEDMGLGVPESERDKVFDRFTRLASEDGTKKPGVGLGLYIVRAIVESHGGSVVVTGRLDGLPGARFEVTLPAAPLTMD